VDGSEAEDEIGGVDTDHRPLPEQRGEDAERRAVRGIVEGRPDGAGAVR
jgi:hypothetical protein